MKTTIRKAIGASLLCTVISVSSFGISDVAAKGNGNQKILNITAEQEACLISAKANIPRGVGRKASIKQAARNCGIWGRFAKLSTTQKACLATYGLSSPAGLPTKAQKKQLKSLAEKCGITLRVKR